MNLMANNELLEPPLGRYSARLDEKGRVKLPDAFQQYVAQRGGTVFVISPDTEDLATKAEMDPRGRIALGAALRQELQLETESQVLLYWHRRCYLAIISEKVFKERQKELSRAGTPRKLNALRRAGLI